MLLPQGQDDLLVSRPPAVAGRDQRCPRRADARPDLHRQRPRTAAAPGAAPRRGAGGRRLALVEQRDRQRKRRADRPAALGLALGRRADPATQAAKGRAIVESERAPPSRPRAARPPGRGFSRPPVFRSPSGALGRLRAAQAGAPQPSTRVCGPHSAHQHVEPLARPAHLPLRPRARSSFDCSNCACSLTRSRSVMFPASRRRRARS